MIKMASSNETTTKLINTMKPQPNSIPLITNFM